MSIVVYGQTTFPKVKDDSEHTFIFLYCLLMSDWIRCHWLIRRDAVNESGHFRVSGHLLNDVHRQQCCSVSSHLNYSSVFRTLDWAYRCIIPGLLLLSLHTTAPCLLEQSLSGVHFVWENKAARLSRCIEILGFHFPTFFLDDPNCT